MKENTLCMFSDSREADDRTPSSMLPVLLYLQACLVEERRTSTTMVHVVHVYDAATPSRLAGSTAHHSTGLHLKPCNPQFPTLTILHVFAPRVTAGHDATALNSIRTAPTKYLRQQREDSALIPTVRS